MDTKTEQIETYAIVEMMGHRKIAGLVQQSSFGAGTLLRVDILNADGKFERTEHIGVASIYCLTEVTKDVCEMVAKNNVPKPSFAYDIQMVTQRALPAHRDYDNDDDEYDEE